MSGSGYQDLLNEHSTRRYNIVYTSRDLANHLTSGLTALRGLGGSDKRMAQFVTWYVTRLEKAEDAKPEHEGSGATIEELRGSNRSYYVILQHYTDLLERKYKTVEELVRQEFPKLSLGVLGSAFHGLIHFGFPFEERHQRSTCEGLAYLHRSYFPLNLSDPHRLHRAVGGGDLDILEAIRLFAEDKDLDDLVEARKDSMFTRRAGVLLASRGDTMVKYVDRIKLPAFYDPELDIRPQLGSVLKWILECAVKVYVMSEARNDFFLIHGVTAAYSLRNVLPLVEDSAQINQSLRVFLCAFLAAYMAQGCPALHPEYLDSLEAETWESMIEKTLDPTMDRDEHIYKLVHVCHVMDLANTDPEMRAVYMRAAQTALKYPLTFGLR